MPSYMQYEGIKGTATGKHSGWIPLDSVSLSVHRSTGSEGDKTASSDLYVTKRVDSSSNLLASEAIVGQPKKVKIDFAKEDGTVYLAMDLENVIVSSYVVRGQNPATENITLNYTKATYKYVAAAVNTTGGPDQSTLALVADPNP